MLVVAVDRSSDSVTVIAVVGVEEHVLKSRAFLYETSWLEHFRGVPSRRKRGYLVKFVRRFTRISRHLACVKILRDVNRLRGLVKCLKPAVVLVDDKLYGLIKDLGMQAVPEGSVRHKHHRRLMLIADNLANYFRILLKTDPKRFKEELRRLEK